MAARRLESGICTGRPATALKVTVNPKAETSTVLVPKFGPRMSVLLALPLASVVTPITPSVPRPAVTEYVTHTPLRAEPSVGSRSSTTKGIGKGALGKPGGWLSPAIFVSVWSISGNRLKDVSLSLPSVSTTTARIGCTARSVRLTNPLANVKSPS